MTCVRLSVAAMHLMTSSDVAESTRRVRFYVSDDRDHCSFAQLENSNFAQATATSGKQLARAVAICTLQTSINS